MRARFRRRGTLRVRLSLPEAREPTSIIAQVEGFGTTLPVNENAALNGPCDGPPRSPRCGSSST